MSQIDLKGDRSAEVRWTGKVSLNEGDPELDGVAVELTATQMDEVCRWWVAQPESQSGLLAEEQAKAIRSLCNRLWQGYALQWFLCGMFVGVCAGVAIVWVLNWQL